ncbi:MAG TPA: hypothetical protein VFC26_08630, partial [Verrucomicrobiae bacterium]|nr:hypothetical protein [Verrucomicrobiae bacterium]
MTPAFRIILGSFPLDFKWIALTVVFLLPASAFADRTWDGGGSTNNWSQPENWTDNTVPVSSDLVIFDGTSTKPVTIDVPVDVSGIQITAGYTGTITQATGANLTINAGGYSQAAGVFNGSAAGAVFGTGSVNTFTLAGGAFNAAGPVTMNATLFSLSGGVFNGSVSTLAF